MKYKTTLFCWFTPVKSDFFSLHSHEFIIFACLNPWKITFLLAKSLEITINQAIFCQRSSRALRLGIGIRPRAAKKSKPLMATLFPGLFEGLKTWFYGDFMVISWPQMWISWPQITGISWWSHGDLDGDLDGIWTTTMVIYWGFHGGWHWGFNEQNAVNFHGTSWDLTSRNGDLLVNIWWFTW